MKTFILNVIVTITIALLTSCGNKNASGIFRPDITGANGEVLVIINDDVKKDTSGLLIESMFSEQYLGLMAYEPMFDMHTVPHFYFNGSMKTFRNIMSVVVSDTVQNDTIQFFSDVWAQPQAMISVRTKTKQALLEKVDNNYKKILTFFTKAERDRLKTIFKKLKSVPLSQELLEKYNVSIDIPNTYNRCNPRHSEDMFWAQINNDNSDLGFLVYDFPYIGEGSMSIQYLLNKRDSLVRNNIEGPQGSFMCTEVRYGLDDIVYNCGKHKGMDVTELRGSWRLEGYPMGGPFILRAHHDTIYNRVIVTDGYVYYPSRERKRNCIRQLEGVMYTLGIKENNK